MKIILLQDVAKIGRRHSIVEVPDGYAQNQLIPKRLALPATPDNLKRITKLHADVAASQTAAAEQFSAVVQRLKTDTLVIKAEANQQEHLFKAVSEKDIAAAASEHGITLQAKAIRLTAPIKSLGAHDIVLTHAGTEAMVTINIIKK